MIFLHFLPSLMTMTYKYSSSGKLFCITYNSWPHFSCMFNSRGSWVLRRSWWPQCGPPLSALWCWKWGWRCLHSQLCSARALAPYSPAAIKTRARNTHKQEVHAYNKHIPSGTVFMFVIHQIYEMLWLKNIHFEGVAFKTLTWCWGGTQLTSSGSVKQMKVELNGQKWKWNNHPIIFDKLQNWLSWQ